MSIKFKQNGQWVKIPTPSQIDDTAASSATTYSSNKINEIIPQDIADYLAKHKDELGTDDFTKLKNVPFQLVYNTDDRFSSTDKMFPWTDEENSSPDKVIDDGVYYIAEDREFTINSCFDMVTFVKIQLGEIEESKVTSKLQTGKFNLHQGAIVLVGNSNAKIISPTDITLSSGYNSDTYTIDEITIAPMGPGQHTICVYYVDGLESTMQNILYDLPYQNAISSAQNDGFSKGDLLVVQNDSTGSGSTPQLKFQSAGAPTTVITDSTYKNYQKTEQWAKVDDGLYYVNTDKLSIELKGVDIKSQISTLFPATEIDDYIDAEKGTQISVTSKKYGNQELGFQTQKLVNIYNTIDGKGYTYSLLFPDIDTSTGAFVSLGSDLINTALSYSYLAANQLGEVLNTCITDESLRGKVPVISAPDEQTATGVKNVFKAMDFPSGVPITVINTANKSEFTTLKGILNHPDGMYLVDDCGVTNGDAQLTIEAFKGHCVEMLIASKQQFEEVTENAEINCYKGTLIGVLSEGDVSDNSATRYVTIYNTPCGVSGEPGDTSRTYPYAGTSIISIEIHPVEDRSGSGVTYSYDIDNGTKTLYSRPEYKAMLSMYPLMYFGGLVSGKSTFEAGQLLKFIEDSDSNAGMVLTGVDADQFKSPITVITKATATNYNTLDKICHLEDGLYICKDTITSPQDNVLTIAFKGVEEYNSYLANETNPTDVTINCKSGALISVFTNKDSSLKGKTIAISQSVDEGSGKYGYYYITADPDSGSGTADSPYVYGSTGANTLYHNEYDTFSYGALGLRTLGAALGIGDAPTDGQYAQWKIENPGTSSEVIKLVGVDAPTGESNVVPTKEINDDNFTDYNTLQKWMNLDSGIYWFSNNLTNSETPGLDETKKISIVGQILQQGESSYTFPENSYIIPCPGSYVVVSKSNDTASGMAYVKHILFYMNNGSNVLGGSDGSPSIVGSMLEFQYDTRNTYGSESVNCINQTELLGYASRMPLLESVLSGTIMALSADTDDGKLVKVEKDADSYTGFKFATVDNPTTKIVEIPAKTTEITLADNSDIRWLGTHNSISLKLPTEKTLSNYKCRVSFKKVNNELGTYTLTLPDDVTWRGDSIDSSTKKFKPDTNTQYTIDFWNDGFGVKANVIQW